MRVFRLAVLAFFAVSPTLSLAQQQPADPAVVDRILAGFDAWRDKWNIKSAAIAVGYEGQIVTSKNAGRDAKKAYPIASLSKAVTAICLKQVMDARGLSMDAPLSTLQPQFDKVKVTIPQKMRDLTLGHLVTMSAGMRPDITEGNFNANYRYGDTRNIGWSRQALKSRGLKGNPGVHFYNNGSYAVLGALLEALTGTDNVTACRDRLFPKGHRSTVGFDGDWIALGGFGGWEASPTDYLAFVMQAFRPNGPIASNLLDLPRYRHPSQGWYYGLGTYYRLKGRRSVFWHQGALCGVTGPDHGAFYAYYENGYAVSVSYSVCSRTKAGRALDGALWDAAH